MTTNETIDGLQEIIDRNQKIILPRIHIGYLIHAVKYLKEQKEEIENLKQTCQSMMEGICLLKDQEAIEPKTEPSAKGYWYICGACGWWLFEVRDTVHFDGRKRIRYCASCGRSVKWE